MPLTMKAWVPGAGEWITVGTLAEGDPEGSITDITGDGGRDVLLFRCEGARSVISRSAGGFDFEVGPKLRAVAPLAGREVLAELGDGESYERDVTSADTLREYTARWTHHAG
jgi:hypothetical protein